MMDAGLKHDQNKPRMSLVPGNALWEIIEVLEAGAAKYSEDNWKVVPGKRRRYYDAVHRHLAAWWSGEQERDSETGLHHLAHAGCCILFLLETALDWEVHSGETEEKEW